MSSFFSPLLTSPSSPFLHFVFSFQRLYTRCSPLRSTHPRTAALLLLLPLLSSSLALTPALSPSAFPQFIIISLRAPPSHPSPWATGFPHITAEYAFIYQKVERTHAHTHTLLRVCVRAHGCRCEPVSLGSCVVIWPCCLRVSLQTGVPWPGFASSHWTCTSTWSEKSAPADTRCELVAQCCS